MRKTFLFGVVGITAIFLFLVNIASTNSTWAAQNNAAGRSSSTALVPNGTHFLVRLNDELSTVNSKANKKFDAITIEPLETSSGYILAPGAKIHGHISRIEPGGATGRARLWLTFDDIDTHHGRLPIVAEVSSVPGDFSVRSGESREGEIEARTSKGTRDLEAAATGAAIRRCCRCVPWQRKGCRNRRRRGRYRGVYGLLRHRPGAGSCRKAPSLIWFWTARYT